APASFPWQAVLAGVWLAGAALMAAYALFSYLRLRRCLFDAIRAEDGAWEHPAVNSPFILGFIRPRIYLPAGLAGQPRQFILCHERAHLRRLDHVVKPVCWVALALHWFNPVVWAAYILMSRDIEAACDEAVIRRLGPKVKADYSATLLALATSRRVPAPCPLAFDEGDAKGRIKNVLRYRRPALWIVVVSVLAAVLAAVCLLTDPVAAKEPDPDPSADPNPSASASQEPVNLADTLLDPWMKELLDGVRTFRSTYNEEQNFTINDLRSFYYGDDQYPDAVVEMGKLAIVDMDRDGVNELIIYPVGDPNDPVEIVYNVGYLILRRVGDAVYGYAYGGRIVGDLKADGTFTWSSSASDGGIRSMSFDGLKDVHNDITWKQTARDFGIRELYFVDGQRTTQEEFDAAIAAQDAKPDPTWYTYADGVLTRILPSIPLD
ncbi:MAG: M56 family metallopeptidase, partial [Oscillospiraceae bacterium]|nr:M56 family metallopeptidase [Oscillospiraceae bacterium]